MTHVKICGCRTVEDALAAAEAGADFIGIMFAESRRRVSLEEASEMVRALGRPLLGLEMESPPEHYAEGGHDLRSWFEHGALALESMLRRKRPLTVGVFANASPDEMNDVAEEVGLDLFQLSGDEPWETCLLLNRQAVKVVHLRAKEQANVVERIRPGSGIAVMLDRRDESAYGGTGKTVDWAVAAEVASATPVWLAGGLNPDNVGEAVRRVGPWCVDVSTGVETDGVKDATKMRAFVRAAKQT